MRRPRVRTQVGHQSLEPHQDPGMAGKLQGTQKKLGMLNFSFSGPKLGFINLRLLN